MKTATITFHASYNYGSMLQAYALQTIIKRLGFENEIINLRTLRQKELYNFKSYKSTYPNIIKRTIIGLFTHFYEKDLKRKSVLFENFLRDNLQLTQEYASEEELQQVNWDCDCFISGGDQIWNTAPIDFDWSFFLPFVKRGKRISYGVSMGPKAESEVTELDRIGDLLKQYSHISVREEGTKKIVERLVGHSVETVLDPVLLIDSTEWKQHYSQKPIIKGDYILLYVPGYRENVYRIASLIGQQLGYKVINTICDFHSIYHKGVKMHCATGPWEFLNILQHARMVVSGSFHAVIFSMLYQKPFVAVNGKKDNRMRTMLERTGLLNRAVSMEDVGKLNEHDLLHCDFTQAQDYILKERIKSIDYLKRAIID